jgi:hypothetical protein
MCLLKAVPSKLPIAKKIFPIFNITCHVIKKEGRVPLHGRESGKKFLYNIVSNPVCQGSWLWFKYLLEGDYVGVWLCPITQRRASGHPLRPLHRLLEYP